MDCTDHFSLCTQELVKTEGIVGAFGVSFLLCLHCLTLPLVVSDRGEHISLPRPRSLTLTSSTPPSL